MSTGLTCLQVYDKHRLTLYIDIHPLSHEQEPQLQGELKQERSRSQGSTSASFVEIPAIQRYRNTHT